MYKLIVSFCIMIFPSKIKISLLRKMGFNIHQSAYIGFSLLNVDHIELKKNTYIGTGNIFNGVSKLIMEEESRINRWNYFTGSSALKTCLSIGERSSISLRHYFDLSGDIKIGHDTIIAGIKSVFLTHSKGMDQIDYIKPVSIGNWCYIGSNSSFGPGAMIGSNCFVGMGSVVVKNYSEESFSLIAGNPAIVKKSISPDCKYFQQKKLIHPHMRRK